MIALAELFPDEDYRFHLTLRRGEVRAFFGAGPAAPRVLAERRAWLAREPERYATLQPEAEAAFAEWAALTAQWGLTPATRTLVELGGWLEPDFLLLTPDAAGEFRLRGGALVFPTSWALEEKLGRTMDDIHGVVPGLNPALGAPIRQFLTRLKPGGPAFLRSNWGLAATDALNLHPSRPRPALVPPLRPARVWLRVEDQILAALPQSGAVLFGIRIGLHPLTDLLGDPGLRAGFRRALVTMPPALVAYKGLAAARNDLLALAA